MSKNIKQKSLLEDLMTWVSESPHDEEAVSRVQAIDLILDAKNSGNTQLSLRGLGLSSLPERLSELTSLTHLDLSYNKLETIPEGIRKLPALKSLDLYENQLNTLPNSQRTQLNPVPFPEINRLQSGTGIAAAPSPIPQTTSTATTPLQPQKSASR